MIGLAPLALLGELPFLSTGDAALTLPGEEDFLFGVRLSDRLSSQWSELLFLLEGLEDSTFFVSTLFSYGLKASFEASFILKSMGVDFCELGDDVGRSDFFDLSKADESDLVDDGSAPI